MSTAKLSHLASLRKDPSSVEMLCRVMVETGGGVFAGVCPGIQGRSEPLVLFNSPATGTTLGCLISELSAELVRSKIAASDALLMCRCGHRADRVSRVTPRSCSQYEQGRTSLSPVSGLIRKERSKCLRYPVLFCS